MAFKTEEQVAQQRATGRRSVTASMTGGLSLPQPPRISIGKSLFTLVDRAGNELMCNLVDPQVGRYLDVVIVDANHNKSKIYYEGDWTPQSSDPPICWSDNGVAPSQASISPQWQTCSGCPHNEIGSDHSKLTGKPIKACQDRKKLAVFVVGDPANELYQFQVTPAALKHLAAYGKWIAKHPSQSNPGQAADVSEVVTRLYFLQGEQGVIGFGAVGPIDAPMDARIESAFAQGLTLEITGKDDQPISGMLAAPAPQAQIAAPAQQYRAPPVAQIPAAAPQPQFQPQAPQQPAFAMAAAPAAVAPQPAPAFGSAPPAPQAYAPPPADDAYAIPAFLQRPTTAPQGAPPSAFSAPPAEAPAKSGRGGARRGAGRKPVEQPAAQQAPPNEPAQPTRAPFQAQAPQPAPQAFAPQPAPGPAAAPQFGMTQPGGPTADMTDALNRAFGTPLPPR